MTVSQYFLAGLGPFGVPCEAHSHLQYITSVRLTRT